MIRSNPPWSNTVLTSHWDQILAIGGPDLMPRHTKARKRIKAEEFGAGHYGVVMPTVTPGIVMKLTSDGTEARFVEWVLRTGFGKDQPGLIPYVKIGQVHGTSKSSRNVYVLWRAEAEEVGKAFDRRGGVSYDDRIVTEAYVRLSRFQVAAHLARSTMDRSSHPER